MGLRAFAGRADGRRLPYGRIFLLFNLVQENAKVANSSLLYELYDLIGDRKMHPGRKVLTPIIYLKGYPIKF